MSTDPRPRAVVSWSSGKDAAYALARAQGDSAFDVVGLLTTVTDRYERVTMHGVREGLLRRQADRLGLPLTVARIPPQCSNAQYDAAMADATARLSRDGVTHLIFGDLFLHDVRRYREDRLRGTGITPLFPLWGRPTASLVREMLDDGFRARVVCVDPRQIPARLAGRELDESFLQELPPTADPCGERGEYHSFVYDAPNFSAPIEVVPGPVVVRDGFAFADLDEAGAPPDDED